ncbi:FAD-dependent oxidoreductase [bacterium]|nr:FAD-dependent oxidoreductase [bacterium]
MQRRDFLKAGGALGLGGALASPVPARAQADSAGAAKSGSTLQADVVVAGGGMSGVCAALAAARAGASVVLIQDRPVLGGNSSSEVRMHICGANTHGIPDSRETGSLEEMRLDNQVRNPQRSAAMWDLILWEKTFYQPGLTLLLNTTLDGCRLDNGRIVSVQCYDMRREEHLTIEGLQFVDCTGDGTLGVLAGNPFRVGCEARGEFDESLAPEQPEPYTLGSTLLFQARDFGRPMKFIPPAWAYRYATDEELGRGHESYEYGYWWLEWGGMLDTIKDDNRIREELLKILLGVWDHIKNRGDHGADSWALDWFGFIPARRESRRLEGAYWLRQNDLTSGRVFEDEVAYGGWPIDHHQREGFYRKNDDFFYQQRLDKLYSIPLRSLYSAKVPNLFFAGRQVSASHVAFCSTRVMATCAVMGQGAGVAAALAAGKDSLPCEFGPQDIEAVKQTLLRQDAYLLGTPNRDPEDFARTAKISATTEQSGFEARKVTDGVARTVGNDSHQWRSQSLEPGKAALTLEFGKAQVLGELHLTFDTDLTRALTLTHEDSYDKSMLAGAQPETVRDYRIQCRVDRKWSTVAEVSGNWQRKCVHRFKDLRCDAVRLEVTATNGAPEARVFEVRCYS